jgi:hypothetical protein
MSPAAPYDPRIPAIAEALKPYAWQRLSAELLARLVVGALDRQFLHRELAGIGDLEASAPVAPAGHDDERVDVVVRALRGCHLRVLTLAAVGAQALRALDAWRDERRWLDIELSWMLDPGE